MADQALADPHRLVDLVGAPPPAVARLEDDEPERVRPEVDHREPRLVAHRAERIDRPASRRALSVLGGASAASRRALGGVERPLGFDQHLAQLALRWCMSV